MGFTQTDTKIKQLNEFGQSIWLDNISCSIINSGELSRLIDLGVSGVTSNPTIFDKALNSSDYDQTIKELRNIGLNTFDIYDELTVKDIQDTADLLMPVFNNTDRIDGYVSLEVNPLLAHDVGQTTREAKRLFSKVNRTNVMFKIPANDSGIEAASELLAEGININFTLIFSVEQYTKVIEAFLRGAQGFLKRRRDLSNLSSVASVFVSRIDSLIDKLIEEKLSGKDNIGNADILQNLKGKASVTNSRLIFNKYLEFFRGKEFRILESKGLRKQRLLWASTSTKNPAYSDIKYITELIGKDTINTMPQATINAFLDHGVIRDTLTKGIEDIQETVDLLGAYGINIKNVCGLLLKDGIKTFVDSFSSLLKTIEAKQRDI